MIQSFRHQDINCTSSCHVLPFLHHWQTIPTDIDVWKPLWVTQLLTSYVQSCVLLLSGSPRDLCDWSDWTLLFIMVIDLKKIRSEYCLIEWDGALLRQDRGVTDNFRLNQRAFSLYWGPKALTQYWQYSAVLHSSSNKRSLLLLLQTKLEKQNERGALLKNMSTKPSRRKKKIVGLVWKGFI